MVTRRELLQKSAAAAAAVTLPFWIVPGAQAGAGGGQGEGPSRAGSRPDTRPDSSPASSPAAGASELYHQALALAKTLGMPCVVLRISGSASLRAEAGRRLVCDVDSLDDSLKGRQQNDITQQFDPVMFLDIHEVLSEAVFICITEVNFTALVAGADTTDRIVEVDPNGRRLDGVAAEPGVYLNRPLFVEKVRYLLHGAKMVKLQKRANAALAALPESVLSSFKKWSSSPVLSKKSLQPDAFPEDSESEAIGRGIYDFRIAMIEFKRDGLTPKHPQFLELFKSQFPDFPGDHAELLFHADAMLPLLINNKFQWTEDDPRRMRLSRLVEFLYEKNCNFDGAALPRGMLVLGARDMSTGCGVASQDLGALCGMGSVQPIAREFLKFML